MDGNNSDPLRRGGLDNTQKRAIAVVVLIMMGVAIGGAWGLSMICAPDDSDLEYKYEIYRLDSQYVGDIMSNGREYQNCLIMNLTPCFTEKGFFIDEGDLGKIEFYPINHEKNILYFADEKTERMDLNPGDFVYARWEGTGENWHVNGIEYLSPA